MTSFSDFYKHTGPSYHNDTLDRDDPDAHPWQSITGLVDELDARVLKASAPLNVKDGGAVGDGASHPLSDYYSTLAEAQVDYPEATSLDDEIDLVAVARCVTLLQTNRPFGGTIFFPRGNYRWNRYLDLSGCINLWLRGEGSPWRNYDSVPPSQDNDCATQIFYTGSAPGKMVYFGDAQRNTYYANANRFSDIAFHMPNDTGNYIMHWHNVGQGFYCDYVFFGGGDKQLYFSADVSSTPYDFYFDKCWFVPGQRISDFLGVYQPNYCVYVEPNVFLGGQSTCFRSSTFRHIKKSHAYFGGRTDILFADCTMEATYEGPSIHVEGGVEGDSNITLSRCHWEGIWYNGYWNAVDDQWQVSSIDSTPTAMVTCGAAGVTHAVFLRIINGCTCNIRVPPALTTIYVVRTLGNGKRLTITDSSVYPASRALVWAHDAPVQLDVARVGSWATPSNGDGWIAGPGGGTTRIDTSTAWAMPTSPALMSGWQYSVASWSPASFQSTMGLLSWKALDYRYSTVAPHPAARQFYWDEWAQEVASDISNFDETFGPFIAGDIVWLSTWGGSSSQLPCRRMGRICINPTASFGNDADWADILPADKPSADLGNADVTWHYGQENIARFATPLTDNRTFSINYNIAVQPPIGAYIRVVREATATGDYNLILEAPSDGGTLCTLTNAGSFADLVRTATGWIVISAGSTAVDSGARSFTYDGEGRLSVVTTPNGTKTMTYDINGRLVSVTGTGVYRSKTLSYTGDNLTGVTLT